MSTSIAPPVPAHSAVAPVSTARLGAAAREYDPPATRALRSIAGFVEDTALLVLVVRHWMFVDGVSHATRNSGESADPISTMPRAIDSVGAEQHTGFARPYHRRWTIRSGPLVTARSRSAISPCAPRYLGDGVCVFEQQGALAGR